MGKKQGLTRSAASIENEQKTGLDTIRHLHKEGDWHARSLWRGIGHASHSIQAFSCVCTPPCLR
jgi:hypothetical protein